MKRFMVRGSFYVYALFSAGTFGIKFFAPRQALRRRLGYREMPVKRGAPETQV